MQTDQLCLWVLPACYVIFFLVSCFAWKEDQLNLDGVNGLLHSLKGINCKHLAGIILLGLPLLLYPELWWNLLQFPRTALMVKVPVILFLLMLASQLALGKAKTRSREQSMAERETGKPDPLEIRWYLMLRISFLIVYECFFRGLLLAVCSGVYGIPAAIFINLIFYAGIHVFNGSRQMPSCILFGMVVCGLTLWSHSVLPAVILHLVLALVYETYLILLPDHLPKTLTS
jgi:membrane protease YdiL (CAAX protease family)